MSNESGAQLSELRDLAHHNIGQLNRVVAGWFEIARKTIDAAEANATALLQSRQPACAGGIANRMRQAADGIREVVDGFDAEAVDGHDACRQGSSGVTETL